MGRSILSIVAGYLTMVVGVSGALAFAAVVVLGGLPTEPTPFTGPTYFLWIELGIGLLAAAAGGYVCVYIARHHPMQHIAVLAVLMAVLGVVSVMVDDGLKPLWSSIAVPLVGILGVVWGGHMRAKHQQP